MLVKKNDIAEITMLDDEHNNFCVVFHLAEGPSIKRGQIVLPCFFVAGFDLDDSLYVHLKARQIELTQKYVDSHPDGSYVELSSRLLYDMDVYH